MKKYKVTPKFMDELEDWKIKWEDDKISVNATLFDRRIKTIEHWRIGISSVSESYKHFGALVNWINGEDVFEIGTPKYIVQRKDAVGSDMREYIHLERYGDVCLLYGLENATRFDDFVKASEWANKHFEVVEVDE